MIPGAWEQLLLSALPGVDAGQQILLHALPCCRWRAAGATGRLNRYPSMATGTDAFRFLASFKNGKGAYTKLGKKFRGFKKIQPDWLRRLFARFFQYTLV